MLLRTLGGLTLDGADFGRAKPLLLVSYLALEGRRERRHVAELFWPGAADHMKSLTVALAQLRKGAPGAVEADASHAWTSVETDAGRFLAQLETGAAEAALELYRGPFLEGVNPSLWEEELGEWVVAMREILAGRAQGALLELAERTAARGDFAAAARRAERAWELPGAPFPEPDDLLRFHRLLTAGGSPRAGDVRREAEAFASEALPGREEARERLRGPGAVRGAGPDLPRPAPGFVGRERELREAAALVARDGARLVTFVGPAGVGKTRLALRVAREQLAGGAYGQGGVRFVALDALAGPERLGETLADALGIDILPGTDPYAAVAARIGGASRLLLLDNFEHLVDGGALRLADLLAACPRLALLVTSRERLNLSEERIVTLDGLPFPGLGTPLAEARRFDAVELFVQRARRARPDFGLDAAELPGVLRICALVGGLPLGLELAAVWVRAMDCDAIAAEIARNLGLLTTSTRDVPERHRSLYGAFDHSWGLLTEAERRVFAGLSVFRGGCDREAARAVTGATLPRLASLVDKSLLRLDERGRYALHPLLQRYAGEKLAERPEAARTVRAAHRRHYLELLPPRGSDLGGEELVRALRAVDADWENLLATFAGALAASRDAGDPSPLLRCVDAVELCFERRGQLGEGLAFLRRAERVAADLPAAAEPERARLLGRILVERAWYHYRLEHADAARRDAAQGIAVLRSLDDHWESKGHNTLGCVAWREGDFAAAQERIATALDVAERHGDELSCIALRNNLAFVLQERGRYPDAERRFREALAMSRALGTVHRTVSALEGVANARRLQGDEAGAERYLREALAQARAIGDRMTEPHLLLHLAEITAGRGDAPEAAALAADALRLAADADRPSLVGEAHLARARADLAAAAVDDAESRAVRVLRDAWEGGWVPLALAALALLAEVRLERGDDALGTLRVVAAHPASAAPRAAARERLAALGAGGPAPAPALDEVVRELLAAAPTER